jgi:hypothetical protein
MAIDYQLLRRDFLNFWLLESQLLVTTFSTFGYYFLNFWLLLRAGDLVKFARLRIELFI